MPKVTVITICYNAAAELQETIASVVRQNFEDFEYLIVDGGSKDESVEIARSYEAEFARRNIPYRITSEQDKGIYDALNKGTDLAEGQWLICMNAGDRFYGENVLSRVFEENTESVDVLYGDTVVKDGKYYQKRVASPAETIYRMMPFCHQSVLVRTELMKKYRFDMTYRIAADYDLFLRLYQDGRKFCHVDTIVSVYDMSGVSETNLDAVAREYDLLRENHGLSGRKSWKERQPVFSLLNFRRAVVKKLVPGVFYSEKRGWTQDIRSIS